MFNTDRQLLVKQVNFIIEKHLVVQQVFNSIWLAYKFGAILLAACRQVCCMHESCSKARKKVYNQCIKYLKLMGQASSFLERLDGCGPLLSNNSMGSRVAPGYWCPHPQCLTFFTLFTVGLVLDI